jgi:cyclase
MIPVRVLPCLLLQGTKLVKTLRFKDPVYVGDPRNAVRIFNEKEVDELAILDISATPGGRPPDLTLIREIVSEAFMPVAYGGGLKTIEQARAVLSCGVEKIVLNTHALENPRVVEQAAREFGSQSVVVCLDVKRTLFGRYEVFTRAGTRRTRMSTVDCAKRMESMGAGEMIVNSIDRDGTMQGFDIDLIQSVANAVRVPVIACGGAGNLEHVREAVVRGGASAVAAGSLFVFHGKHRAVLINYPKPEVLSGLFCRRLAG